VALSLADDGQIVAVTGNRGRVYRIAMDGTASLLRELDEFQPWAVVPASNGGLWLGSAGAGKVCRLSSGYGKEGTLTSEARDFSLVSHWGRVAWRAETPGGTSLAFQTRSGNSESPDDTWSSWSSRLLDAEGSHVTSPAARFVQYRALLSSADGRRTPRLLEVMLSGLQENVEPLVLQLSVTPPYGQDATRAGPGNRGNASNGGKPARSQGPRSWRVAWSAGDANGDLLRYSLHFRGAMETEWKLLEDDIAESEYIWNTEAAPEGAARLRLVVSDHPSNPPGTALSSARESALFVIDHTPPTVTLSDVSLPGPSEAVVEGQIVDAISPLREAAYAIDAGPWHLIHPEDRIFDARSEAIRIVLASLEPGEHTVVVRASDAAHNVGVGRAIFRIR